MSLLFTDEVDPKLFNSVRQSCKERTLRDLRSEIKELLKKINKDIETEEDEPKTIMKDMFSLLGKYRKIKELK